MKKLGGMIYLLIATLLLAFMGGAWGQAPGPIFGPPPIPLSYLNSADSTLAGGAVKVPTDAMVKAYAASYGAAIPVVVPLAATGDVTPAVGTAGADIRIISSAARTAALTVNTPTGTPVNGQKLTFAILGDATPRALDFTTSTAYKVIGTVLPTTTVASKWTYVGCIYNSLDAKWHVPSVSQE